MKKDKNSNPVKVFVDCHSLETSDFADLYLYVKHLADAEDKESCSVQAYLAYGLLAEIEKERIGRKIEILESPEGCYYVHHIVD